MSLRALWIFDVEARTILLSKRFPSAELKYLRLQKQRPGCSETSAGCYGVEGVSDEQVVEAIADRLKGGAYALADSGPFVMSIVAERDDGAVGSASNTRRLGPFVLYRPHRGAAVYVPPKAAGGGASRGGNSPPPSLGALPEIQAVFDSPDDVKLLNEGDPLADPATNLLIVGLASSFLSPLQLDIDGSDQAHGACGGAKWGEPGRVAAFPELVASFSLLAQSIAPFLEHTLVVCPSPRIGREKKKDVREAFISLQAGPTYYDVIGGWSVDTSKRRVVKYRHWVYAVHLLIATGLPFGQPTPMLPSHHAGAMLVLANATDSSTGQIMSPALEPEALFQRLESGGGDSNKIYRGSEMLVVGDASRHTSSDSVSAGSSSVKQLRGSMKGGSGEGAPDDFASTSTTSIYSSLPPASCMPLWIEEEVVAQIFGRPSASPSSPTSPPAKVNSQLGSSDLVSVSTRVKTKAPQSPDMLWMEQVETARTKSFGPSSATSLLAALDYFPVAVLGLPHVPNVLNYAANTSAAAADTTASAGAPLRSTPLVIDETLVADIQHWGGAGVTLPAVKKKSMFTSAGGALQREADLTTSVVAAIGAAQFLARQQSQLVGEDFSDDAESGTRRARVGLSVLHFRGAHQLGYQRTSGLFRPEGAVHQPHTILSFANDIVSTNDKKGHENPSAGKIFLGEYSLLPLITPVDVVGGMARLKKELAAGNAGSETMMDEVEAQLSWIRNVLEEKSNHVLYAMNLELALNLDCGSTSISSSKLLAHASAEAKADLTRMDVTLTFLDKVKVAYFYFPATGKIDETTSPLANDSADATGAASSNVALVKQTRSDQLLWRVAPATRLRHQHVLRARGFVILDLSRRLPSDIVLEPTTISSNVQVADLRRLTTVCSSANAQFVLRVDRPVLPYSLTLVDPLTAINLALNPPPGSNATIDTSNADAVDIRTTLNTAPVLANRNNELQEFPHIVRVELPTEVPVTSGEHADVVQAKSAVALNSYSSRMITSSSYTFWNFVA